jgi:hypothetical protein
MTDIRCKAGTTKSCKKCSFSGGDDDFYWVIIRRKKDGSRYKIKSALCRVCHNKRQTQRIANNRPRAIFISCKKHDKRAGRECDLTVDFVRSILHGPCVYCGDETLPLTLDRKDNALGHLRTNVTVACIRCNTIRGAMPLLAWLVVAEAIRKAREMELFGEWIGTHSSKMKYPRC